MQDNTLAAQQLSYFELLFLTAQSSVSFRKSNIGIIEIEFPQVTNSAKVYEKDSETEHVFAQSNESQKTYDLIKRIEELLEAIRFSISELSDIEILMNFLHVYDATYFTYL